MAKTTDIFAHTIYEAEYVGYSDIKESLIDYINKNFNNEYVDGLVKHDHPIRSGELIRIYDRFTYENQKKTIDDPNLKSLFNWITEQGKEYWKILSLSNQLDPYILQLLVTKVQRGGFVSTHNHNPVPISGVFYLNAEPRLGNLYLENPLDLVLGKNINNKDTTTPSKFNYEIQAISGKLVLFPGWMKHFTDPNPTDEMRMSMAVNFGCQGQVYFTEFA